jgi:hypothetical protein
MFFVVHGCVGCCVVVELGPIPKITRIRHIFRGTKQQTVTNFLSRKTNLTHFTLPLIPLEHCFFFYILLELSEQNVRRRWRRRRWWR